MLGGDTEGVWRIFYASKLTIKTSGWISWGTGVEAILLQWGDRLAPFRVYIVLFFFIFSYLLSFFLCVCVFLLQIFLRERERKSNGGKRKVIFVVVARIYNRWRERAGGKRGETRSHFQQRKQQPTSLAASVAGAMRSDTRHLNIIWEIFSKQNEKKKKKERKYSKKQRDWKWEGIRCYLLFLLQLLSSLNKQTNKKIPKIRERQKNKKKTNQQKRNRKDKKETIFVGIEND